MRWITWLRVGSGVVLVSIVGAAFTMIGSERDLAEFLFVLAFIVGVAVILLAMLAHQLRSRTEHKLADLYLEAQRMRETAITSNEMLVELEDKMDDWYNRTGSFLEKKLSRADAAIFRNTHGRPSGQYSNAFSHVHNNLLSLSDRSMANLRSIMERYLETKP
jgi:hypothetical protein